MKQLCNHRVRDFAMASQARKLEGAFEKRAPGNIKRYFANCKRVDLKLKQEAAIIL